MRVKGGTVTHARRKKILKRASGYFGSKHLLFKTAKEQVLRSERYAYVSRRLLKRDFRKLWIKRINSECRFYGLSYSRFVSGLKKADVNVNRKMLAELAVNDKASFEELINLSKKFQNAPTKKVEAKPLPKPEPKKVEPKPAPKKEEPKPEPKKEEPKPEPKPQPKPKKVEVEDVPHETVKKTEIKIEEMAEKSAEEVEETVKSQFGDIDKFGIKNSPYNIFYCTFKNDWRVMMKKDDVFKYFESQDDAVLFAQALVNKFGGVLKVQNKDHKFITVKSIKEILEKLK